MIYLYLVLQNRFRQVVTYTGEVSRGRFGLSLTKLGDINKDGIDGMSILYLLTPIFVTGSNGSRCVV